MTAESRFSIDKVRAAASTRVEKSSLRAVASEIGISWRGLQYFLDGKEPRVATGKKLMSWYTAQRQRKSGPQISAADLRAAAQTLGDHAAAAGTEAGMHQRLKKVIALIAEIAQRAHGKSDSSA